MNTSTPKKKILLIDDDPDILDIICGNLIAKDYQVITALDGQKALQIVEQNNPDLIIVDLMMPGINGWRFCQIIRQDKKFEAYKYTPIIALSALVDEEGPAKKLEFADFYMGKPFDNIKLQKKIIELLKKP